MLLKGNFARRSWLIDEVMGVIPLGGIVASELALNEPQFCFKRATIAPRSGHNRASIVLSILQQTPSNDRSIDSAFKEPRSRLDHTVIAVRSRHDRGFLPRVFPAL